MILKVEKRDIQLLGLDGQIKKIPRHEIASLSYYPVGQLPASSLPKRPSVPAVHIKTLLDGEIVDLATGWPVDYSETKIAFLLSSGRDIVIEKDSIWSLKFIRELTNQERLGRVQVDFVHPQTAGFCASENSNKPNARPVFAQQILNDRVVIKRELDRLQEGYEQILEFEADQKFYPVPHVYRDKTSLGLWVSALSRYGASKSRSNNFTPILVDELHLGPFRYQHLFLSGSAPNTFLLHAEAQSQIFYRFKAAYFHTSVFADPNVVLVGNRYDWESEDLEDESLDDRLNEAFALEFGFDFGPISIQLAPFVITQTIVKAEISPDRTLLHAFDNMNLWRAGLRYTTRLWQAEVWGGANKQEDCCGEDESDVQGEAEWLYLYGRANLSFSPHEKVSMITSLIYRKLEYEADSFSFEDNDAFYRSHSITGALRASVVLNHRFEVGGNAVLEVHSRQGPSETSMRTRVFPKFGAFTSFSF